MRTPSEPGRRAAPDPPRPGARDLALCRGILYEALALGFRSPERETCERLLAPDGNEALQAAAAVLADRKTPDLAERARALATGREVADRLGEEYQRIFGHSVRGEVPLFETEFGGGSLFQQPQELADLGGFLRAFGLVTRPEAKERIDHVACECEFMLFLCRREAHGIETGDDESVQVSREAQRRFLRHHLGRFGFAFSRRLQGVDPDGFYGALGQLFDRFLRTECRRLEVKPGIENLPLRRSGDGVPMACGRDSGPIRIESPHRREAP